MTHTLASVKKEKDDVSEMRSKLSVFYPEGAYGLQFPPDKPNAVLINDATLWTCGPNGTLAEWDILFVDGKIVLKVENLKPR